MMQARVLPILRAHKTAKTAKTANANQAALSEISNCQAGLTSVRK